jgi:Rad3-related DNA helicase
VVALSATLSPVRFYRDLLGLTHHPVDHVEMPTAFPPENLSVVVAPRVSTRFSDRAAHAERTAAMLTTCIEAVPGNAAVFFPSFAMLEDIMGRVHPLGRALLIQERSMSEERRAAWLDALDGSPKPTVLAAVAGGIFAEGVDLPPGALSAVFIAGPSLPPIGLERNLLTELYEQRYGEGFLYASLVPGMTRVIQAAGRLIRRPEDRGIVVLLGRRFRWRAFQELFPDSWQPEVALDPVEQVRAFFPVST